ncbi:hypothetical protein RJT34_12613 [Clitoria ternatea]|uniref:Retrotransposon gag domain-containing protein n=1 Tax=Clitoria ternatea TaxID=43366 RepID=A0AAN9JP90_CLITE
MTHRQSMEAIATAFQRFADVFERQGQTRAEDDHVLDRFLKRKPSEFQGGRNLEAAFKWTQELERIFGGLRCTEAQKVECAVYVLRDEAENWWKIARSRFPEDDNQLTWNDFKTCFLEKYFPDTVRSRKELEFMELKQGSMTVEEYATRFEELCLFYPPFQQPGTESSKCLKFENGLESSKCLKFENGLRSDIKRACRYHEIRSFPALVNKCRIFEEDDRAHSGQSSRANQHMRPQHSHFKRPGNVGRN